MRPVDLVIGKRHHKLIVLGMVRINNRRKWKCRCDCGSITYQNSESIRSGTVKSCGCHKLELFVKRNTKHGLSHTPEYKVWENMISRCYNEDTPYYKHYGGRGIEVCKRWRESFANFFEDMGKRPSEKYSLDRIDNQKGYNKSNCRWTTQREQLRNRRGNVELTIDGVTKTLVEWSECSGIKYATIRCRLKTWTDVKRAVFHPPLIKRGK